jgi:hypothetical protein
MTSFINDDGQEILIGEDVTITKQVASFRNFKIKGDVSISFRIPNTSDNLTALGYYGVAQIDNPAFSRLPFNLTRAGNVINRGYIVIERDNDKDLEGYFISGNANWFRSFDFNCKDITNSTLTVLNNFAAIETSWGLSAGSIVSDPRTYGIVFPLIDVIFKGFRNSFKDFGQSYKDIANYETLTPQDACDIFPALYAHTLLSELAKVAGIKIEGTLTTDAFFKSLIITPESPDLIEPSTGLAINYAVLDGLSNITLGMIAPDMKAIDFIKWCCFSFGCVPVYDTYSSKLTLNIVDKFQKENADDWSEYLKEFNIIYSSVTQNNYLRVKEPNEKFDFAEFSSFYGTFISTYDNSIDVKYGELNIESEKDDESKTEIYKSPFRPIQDFIMTEGDDIAVPYIPFYELEDGDVGYYFGSITSLTDGYGGSNPNLVGSGYPFTTFTPGLIVRVYSSGLDGYHLVDQITTAATCEISATYTATGTGTFWIQKIKKGNPGARVLSYIPRIAASGFTNKANFKRSSGTYANVATAYYFKETTGYATLDSYKKGLSYGAITGKADLPLSETYLNNVSKAVKNPTIRTKMILPESVFNSFEFDRFIYLDTGMINGYFLVESILNYKDSNTLVEVNLYNVN